jgi:hypothetical protein
MPPKVVEKQSTAPQKILIVLSDTGGGHKASASSISSAIEFLQPEIEVKTVDVIENYTPWFSNRLYNVSSDRPLMNRFEADSETFSPAPDVCLLSHRMGNDLQNNQAYPRASLAYRPGQVLRAINPRRIHPLRAGEALHAC